MLEQILRYHQDTKHSFGRFAQSLGFLDWSNQPSSFREFNGSPTKPLLRSGFDRDIPYDALFAPDGPGPRSLDLESVSHFLRYALGLSAAKRAGATRWPLRVNPSSGNLHPTEGYLILGPTPRLSDAPGVYHYNPRAHVLELRCRFPTAVWAALTEGLPAGSFLAALTSVPWRESWKYGERAFRYCLLDAGHALAALRFSAVLQGWRLQVLANVTPAVIDRVLGLDRENEFIHLEEEDAELLCLVSPEPVRPKIEPGRLLAVAEGEWFGKAGPLSRQPLLWKIINEAALAARFQGLRPTVPRWPCPDMAETPAPTSAPAADAILLQRRSGLGFDGKSRMSHRDFLGTLERLLPRQISPWDALAWPPVVHPVFFVHRVEGFEPGIYILVRDPQAEPLLRASMIEGFLWERPEDLPEHLPFYLLHPGDMREIAETLSCRQEIAADGHFAVAMLAEFERPLQEHGSWFYRQMHWEAGCVGQVLYLEAEARGARGTGIGCYFDDPVHELVGLKGQTLQSLYHFTVGVPVEDPRVITEAGYGGEG
jgi:SagB-type dehydrogenase family enzyme